LTTRRVGVLVFDQVEVLDFAGPFEVFSVARREEGSRRDSDSPCPPVLIAPHPGTVTATGGLKLIPDALMDQPGPIQALVIPGGFGVRALMEDEGFLETLRRLMPQLEVCLSVCTGAAVLARAGMLAGRPATTHHRYLDWLAELAPDCRVQTDQRVVDDGDIITSGGISAGIDAALHLLGRWEGEAVAEETADYMEYRRDDRRTA